jgi:hypothetical protein
MQPKNAAILTLVVEIDEPTPKTLVLISNSDSATNNNLSNKT